MLDLKIGWFWASTAVAAHSAIAQRIEEIRIMVPSTVAKSAREIAGLCADCRHSRVVRSERSTFFLCERSLSDRRYPKYPPLPVVACPGYEPREPNDKLTK